MNGSAPAPSRDPVAVAQAALERLGGLPGALLPVLHAVQDELGCIPPAAVPAIAAHLSLSRAEVQGVITYYHHFRTQPPGRHVLEVCQAESCQSMGALDLAEHAKRRLGCDFHQTTADNGVTLEPVYCLGLCAQSPAVALDGQPHARMTATRLDKILRPIARTTVRIMEVS